MPCSTLAHRSKTATAVLSTVCPGIRSCLGLAGLFYIYQSKFIHGTLLIAYLKER
jgi:hypothetical protein